MSLKSTILHTLRTALKPSFRASHSSLCCVRFTLPNKRLLQLLYLLIQFFISKRAKRQPTLSPAPVMYSELKAPTPSCPDSTTTQESVRLLRALWMLVDASGKSFGTLSIQEEQQLEGSDSTTAPYNGRTSQLTTQSATGLSPRDVSTTRGAGSALAPAHSDSRRASGRYRLPAVVTSG